MVRFIELLIGRRWSSNSIDRAFQIEARSPVDRQRRVIPRSLPVPRFDLHVGFIQRSWSIQHRDRRLFSTSRLVRRLIGRQSTTKLLEFFGARLDRCRSPTGRTAFGERTSADRLRSSDRRSVSSIFLSIDFDRAARSSSSVVRVAWASEVKPRSTVDPAPRSTVFSDRGLFEGRLAVNQPRSSSISPRFERRPRPIEADRGRSRPIASRTRRFRRFEDRPIDPAYRSEIRFFDVLSIDFDRTPRSIGLSRSRLVRRSIQHRDRPVFASSRLGRRSVGGQPTAELGEFSQARPERGPIKARSSRGPANFGAPTPGDRLRSCDPQSVSLILFFPTLIERRDGPGFSDRGRFGGISATPIPAFA